MDTKFSIALHILVYMNETDNTVTSDILAKSVGTNASHIRKIISLLRDSDIVETGQGKKGMRIKVDTRELTLDRVYLAVYPEKELLHVHETFNKDCPVGANIKSSLLSVFEEAEKQLMLNLSSKSLHDIIKDMYTKYNKNKELEEK